MLFAQCKKSHKEKQVLMETMQIFFWFLTLKRRQRELGVLGGCCFAISQKEFTINNIKST